MPILFAKKWDAQRNHWRDDPPTIAEACRAGSPRRSARSSRISAPGIVTLAIIWRDRLAAAQWANALVAEADAALRQRAIAEFTRSIDYLKQEGATTPVVEVRAAMYKTMETELKNAMLARTRDAYAFKVIDPAVVRDPKDTRQPEQAVDHCRWAPPLGF